MKILIIYESIFYMKKSVATNFPLNLSVINQINGSF